MNVGPERIDPSTWDFGDTRAVMAAWLRAMMPNAHRERLETRLGLYLVHVLGDWFQSRQYRHPRGDGCLDSTPIAEQTWLGPAFATS